MRRTRNNNEERRVGAQTMTGALKRVVLVSPSVHTPSGLNEAGWGEVEWSRLREEFSAFHERLVGLGIEVSVAPPSPLDNPDAIYAFDPVLVTTQGSVLLRSGKRRRRREPAAMAAFLETLGIPILGGLSAPATMDAGDGVWVREDLLAIGLGWRTNTAAVEQLRVILRPLGVEVQAFDLPNYLGPGHCLHLMSLVSLLSDELALCEGRWLPVRFVELLLANGLQLLEVDTSEVETLGVNVLSLGEGRVLSLGCNPKTNALMRAEGIEIVDIEGGMLCLPGTGGPTCLTRPIWRG